MDINYIVCLSELGMKHGEKYGCLELAELIGIQMKTAGYVRYSFSKVWVCQHSRKNKKNLKVQKYSGCKRCAECKAKLQIIVKKVTRDTIKKDTYLRRKPILRGLIRVNVCHSHSTASAEALRMLRVNDEVKNLFYGYFSNGMTRAEAMRFHKDKYLKEEDVKSLANAAINPTINQVRYLYCCWKQHGQPSKNPSDPDYVPSVFDTSSKNTSPRKTSTTPPADDTESDKTTQVWTSLLQLQPITSEAGTSGLSEPSAQNQKPEEPEKPSTKAAVTGIWKSKTKPKPKPRPRKRPRTPSPPPAESKIIDPLKLCVVKMEIEDDGYNQNEEESFLASLTPSSSQTSHNDTLSFDSASSIKTEPNQEPTIYKLVPTISESAPTNSTQQDVEVFFKNVAQTVMQLPLHLIEETKTKVSALVYEMVIQAMREGSTNITQHKL
ncbi:uncharacterized protein [Parasteatoda tepidariorum]|uniref:uncharacterized protein isoform X1 n=1 Tax=Parasteatoda tepidariorum TaxID=114398 RepID=UPI0039BC784E